ncbi:PAS domain S-box protein [Caballeronia cordobensis]|uniref:PAS domain S-box protein n=1 Tax=Caballeronia cordobensis TaxID=1353886 RepID=UPI000A9C512B|nr:PAS domain S-box protein [Caballeronia cordobensis]
MRTPDGTPDNPAAASPLQSDAHFRLLVESVEDYAIFLLDAEGRVATWNNGAKRIKGYDAQDIVGRHFSVFYPPEDIAAGKPQKELAAAAHTGRVEDEGWRVRRDSTRFWANVVITALRDAQGALIGFAKVTRDMTDRLRLAELQHARALSAHVQTALENERASIARELHDDLGQQLAALKMQLATLDANAGADGFARHALTQTRAMETQIDTVIASVRRIAAGLRPTGSSTTFAAVTGFASIWTSAARKPNSTRRRPRRYSGSCRKRSPMSCGMRRRAKCASS